MDGSDEYTDARSDAGSSESSEKYSEANNGVSYPPGPDQSTVPVPGGHTSESSTEYQVEDSDLFGSGTPSTKGSPERKSPHNEGFADLSSSDTLQQSTDSSFEVISHSSSADSQLLIDEQTHKDQNRNSNDEHGTDGTRDFSEKPKPPPVPPKPKLEPQPSRQAETRFPDQQSLNPVQIGDQPGETSEDMEACRAEKKRYVIPDPEPEERAGENGQDLCGNEQPPSHITDVNPSRLDDMESNVKRVASVESKNKEKYFSDITKANKERSIYEDDDSRPEDKTAKKENGAENRDYKSDDDDYDNDPGANSERTPEQKDLETDASYHPQALQLDDQEFLPEDQDSQEGQSACQVGVSPPTEDGDGEQQARLGEDETSQFEKQIGNFSLQGSSPSHPEQRPSEIHQEQPEGLYHRPSKPFYGEAHGKNLNGNLEKQEKPERDMSPSSHKSEHYAQTTCVDTNPHHGFDQSVEYQQYTSKRKVAGHTNPDQYPNISGAEHSPDTSAHDQHTPNTAAPVHTDPDQHPDISRPEHRSDISTHDSQIQQSHFQQPSGMSLAEGIPQDGSSQNPKQLGPNYGQSLPSQYQANLNDPQLQQAEGMSLTGDGFQPHSWIRFEVPKPNAGFMGRGSHGSVPNQGRRYFSPSGRYQGQPMYSHGVRLDPATGLPVQPPPPYPGPYYTNPDGSHSPLQHQQGWQQYQQQHPQYQHRQQYQPQPQQPQRQYQHQLSQQQQKEQLYGYQQQHQHQHQQQQQQQQQQPRDPSEMHQIPRSYVDQSSEKKAQKESVKTVRVEGISKDLTSEKLQLYFENNRRSGGGDVEDITIDENHGTAIITFESEEDAKRVLEKKNHTLSKHVLKVFLHVPSKDSVSTKTIMVSGLPSSMTKDTLELYFENTKRSCGDTVLDVKITGDVGYITFKEDGIAEKVVSKTDHKLSNCALSVTLHHRSSANYLPRTLVVSGYRPTMEDDTIEMYFESRKVSGGCEVEIRREKDICYVTFHSDEAVERVMNCDIHILEKQTLTVIRAGEESPTKVQSRSGEDREKEPILTVEVKGYGKNATEDSISLYFENKRKSGGGDIDEIHRDERKGVTYITFMSEEVVKRVLSSQHTLSGQKLDVKLSVPQVMYKDKVLLTGVPVQSSQESLSDYLEARTSLEVDDVLYGEEDGELLVSFSDAITDFKKFTESLSAKPFKQRGKVTVFKALQVPQTASITVHELPDKATEDLILSYFENKKRSGGGDVEEVKLQTQESYAVVQFKEPEVADAVTKRQHTLCKIKVAVSLNFECLGERGGSLEPPLSKLPDPIAIKDVDNFILRNLSKNQRTLEQFQETMSGVYVKIDIHLDSKEITLTPTLTLSSLNVKRVIKTWHEKAKNAFESVLEALAVQKIPVNSEIWPDVDAAVKEFRETQDTEIFTEEKDWIVVITGPKENVSATSHKIEQTIRTIQSKYDRKKNEETKHMKVNSAKLRLLFTQRIFEEVCVNDLNVNVNVETGEVCLTGQKSDIQIVKMKILEELNNVKQQTISRHFSQNQMELLKRPTVWKYLAKKIEEQPRPVTGHWEPGREGIIVYYTQEEGVDDVLAFLKASIKESTQRLDPENLPLLSSSGFQQRIDLLTDEHDRRIIITPDEQGKQIIITAVSHDAATTESEVQNYVDKNSIYRELLKCDKVKVKFLLLHCQRELRGIRTNMKQFCVDFIFENETSSIYVKSTKSGLSPAKKQLHSITQKITAHKRHLNRPGLKQYLESESLLKQVEQDTRCVITLKEHLDEPEEEEDEDADVTHDVLFVCRYDHTRQLHIAVGDLVSLVSAVDVVVVEATPNLGTDSNQAWDVIRKAGEEAVSEVRSFASRSGGMLEGEIFCSSAGNLNCKMIVHAVGPTRMIGQRDVIKAVVITSLEEALKKNKRSVALPAFNTSMVTSPNDALGAVVEAVYTFYDENRNSSVINTYLCVEDWSQSQLLWDVTMEVFGQENVKSNSDEVSVTDSLHGGNRRGMGRRNESMRDPSLAAVDEDLGATGGVDREELPPPSGPKIPRPRILLVKADMGVEEADVIVNSSNTDLNLSRGQVSISLLKHAGPDIQEECKQKYPSGLKMGDIAVTKGGDMQCVEEIYHCTLPQWKNDTGQKTFIDVLNKLLKKAHNAQWKTMAIPALGTGNLGYSRDLVAKLMYETVIQFGKDMPETTINDVLFIVYPGDSKTIVAFEAEHRKYVEASGGTVASSQKEIEEERMAELEDYRDKQGYAEKFGKVTRDVQSAVSKLAYGAKAMLMGRKHTKPAAPVAREKPAPVKTTAPAPAFTRSTLSRPVSQPSQVPLWVYTDNESNVTKAVNMIYDEWDRKATKKEIKEESLRSWSKDQIEELIQVENTFGVAITINKDQGRISVHGLINSASDACGSIYDTIRRIERENNEREFAEEVLKLVQWCLVEITDDGDDKIVPYDKNVNAKLERAYTRDKQKELRYGGYVFDFDNWVEYPDDDPKDRVQIIRRDKIAAASSNLPETWDTTVDKDVQLKQVSSGLPEFKEVKRKFEESMGQQAPGQIVRLDRIQSKTLYQQYHAKKQQMEKQNSSVAVEKTLWHGTNMDATVSISTYGFNRSYCDKEQNALGEGAYFTTNAGYAARDRYAPADSQGRRYMFMCKVLTGSFTKGQPKIRVPPPKDQQNPQVLYDSVVDDPANPQTFVIFSDTQAYPEYLISFQ